MQHCETPEQAAAYWKTHIATHPYFNSECECLVVFILNTRRRIKGHYLVSIGTMDTILCHPREVFRLAIMASAAAIIIAHNLCAATHKLCYVKHRVMCSARLAALTLTRASRRREYYAR
jgi:DNA repair protein RadC